MLSSVCGKGLGHVLFERAKHSNISNLEEMGGVRGEIQNVDVVFHTSTNM